MADHKPETVSCDSMLFEALRVARVPDRLSFNAYKEIHEMAGTNIDARFDAIDRKLRELGVTIRWSVGIFISLLLLICAAFTAFANFVVHQVTR